MQAPFDEKQSKYTAHVFVRVRPPLNYPTEEGEESKEEIQLAEDLALVSDLPGIESSRKDVSAINGKLPIGGYQGIFGINDSTSKVYRHAFQSRVGTVMKGGTSSLFCYGYTGAGKTFTVLGNEDNEGIFLMAGRDLLQRISDINDLQHCDGGTYLLIASAIEIYDDNAYDLLGDRAHCSLRKNSRGQLLVRGATRKHEFTEEEAKENGFDYSILTTSLSAKQIGSVEDLLSFQREVSEHRKVGVSTEHEESSRSHAILRFDVVNLELLNSMNELEEAESLKPAIQTAYDKKRTYKLRHKVLDIENKIKEKSQEIDDMYSTHGKNKSCFGGRMILVDLAGADSDGRGIGEAGQTLSQRKESAAINKSLLALKECIRALASSTLSSTKRSGNIQAVPRKIPFRNSSLTRLLEEILCPNKSRESNSVMLVNIGPEAKIIKKTLNSLRYGQIHATKILSSGSYKSFADKPSRNTRSSLVEFKRKMKEEMKKKSDKENNGVDN